MSGDWYEHVLIDGRWEHAYDAYLNHPASGAKAKRRGESTDYILCNCTDEQSMLIRLTHFGPTCRI